MPNQDINERLTTHPPNPDFVASTRQMLRSAWQAPLPEAPEPIGPAGDGSLGYISRWIALGAAAGLVVVAIGAIVVLGRASGAPNQVTAPTDAPTIAPVESVAPTPTTEAPIVVPASDVVPATPPPATSTTVAPPTTTPRSTTSVAAQTSTTIPALVADSTPATLATETTSTTSTTAPPVTTTTPRSIYARAKVPGWAQISATDPVAQFPKDGTYAAVGANSDATVQLAQVFVGDACAAHFPEINQKTCSRGFAFDYDPEVRSIGLESDTPVIAPFSTPNEGVVYYRLPASEFARLIRGSEPDRSAPAGIELVQDSVGSYGVFQLRDGTVEALVYPRLDPTTQEG